MKKIVLLLLFGLYAGQISAQIKEGDLLIGRQEYLKLKKENAEWRHKSLLLDSLEVAYRDLLVENELLLYQFAEKLDKSEKKIAALQQDNRNLNLAMQDQKARTNEYRYAYIRSGRFKERATYATLWAALMSVGFVMAAGENYEAAYILGAGSAAVTLFLTIKSSQAGRAAGAL